MVDLYSVLVTFMVLAESEAESVDNVWRILESAGLDDYHVEGARLSEGDESED